jgi:hypothetical protein
MSNQYPEKPWFREDIARALQSIYTAFRPVPSPATQRQAGFADAIVAVALAVGVNPEELLLPEDIQRIRSEKRR